MCPCHQIPEQFLTGLICFIFPFYWTAHRSAVQQQAMPLYHSVTESVVKIWPSDFYREWFCMVCVNFASDKWQVTSDKWQVTSDKCFLEQVPLFCYFLSYFFLQMSSPMHCVLVAAIIVKALKWKKKKIVTHLNFNQIESIFHQLLRIPRH